MMPGLPKWVLSTAARMSKAMATIDKEFLSILVCPQSRAPLVQVGDWLYSTDLATRKRYPIRDGIPIMLIDEAETVEEEELTRILSEAGAAPRRHG